MFKIDGFLLLQDPGSPLLRSDVAFQLYLTALVNTGLSDSVNAAVRRRESLLASTPALDVSKSAGDTAATTSDPSISALPTSRSQDIAQAVLSGKAIHPSVNSAGMTPELAQLAAAFASGAGNRANPIYVAVNSC
jgi:ATP-dependent metalloprotease